jgi:uncharacterized protein (TIGR04255 family)
MERFAPLFHDALRAEMPHLDELELQQMQIEFGLDGVKVNQVPLKFWQIASPDRKFAFVLTRDSLALHTNSYRDHKSFIERFKAALSTLVAIPEIGINWVTGIAMRYVDLIVPPDGDDLNKLLVPSVLPPAFSDVADLNIVEGVYVAQYRTAKANVRFQILRNPQSAIPPDIDTPLILQNNWGRPRPKNEFAVVDTECAAPITDAVPLDVIGVGDHMYNLRFVAKSIFEHIGTVYARSLWGGEAS